MRKDVDGVVAERAVGAEVFDADAIHEVAVGFVVGVDEQGGGDEGELAEGLFDGGGWESGVDALEGGFQAAFEEGLRVGVALCAGLARGDARTGDHRVPDLRTTPGRPLRRRTR